MGALRRNIVCLASLIACLTAAVGSAQADAGDPLAYYGGPVAHAMTGLLVDWGPRVNRMYTNATAGDPALLGFLAAASGRADVSGGALAQYLDSTGQNAANDASYAGDYRITPGQTTGTIQDRDVASELVTQIETGRLPSPAGDGLGTLYLVLFPAGATVCGHEGCTGQEICSYHSSTELPDGRHVLYAVLPDNTAGGMTQGCGDEPTALQNQTSYLTHEWDEAITDPLIAEATSAAPPLAWYDANCPSSNSPCGEISDKCNQETTVQGGWTVQLVWSNLDHACVGGEARYAAPTADFAVPAAAAPGLPLQFAASASDPQGNVATIDYGGRRISAGPGIVSYHWSWGDGTAASGAAATHAYSRPGVYTVGLTVRDALGFSTAASHAVGVWGPGGAPAPATGGATGVRATRVKLTGTVATAGISVGYRFDYGTASLDHSTPAVSLAGATRAAPASAALSGLAPGTAYQYRLDVVVGELVIPGAVRSFRTPGATAASARVHKRARSRSTSRRHAAATRRHRGSRVRVHRALDRAAVATRPVATTLLSQPAAPQALHDGVYVRVSCPVACHAKLMVTLRLGPAAVPRVLAQATVPVAGTRTVRLHLLGGAGGWLARLHNARFAASGYLVGG